MSTAKKQRVEIPSMEQIEAERKRVRYKKSFKQTMRSTAAVLLVVAAIVILLATLWIPVLQTNGSSMSPSLEDGQIVIAIKGSSYDVGDMVGFYYGNKLLVKRVIAGPGDWVNIELNGDVYVNGTLLDEPYVKEKAYGECDQTFPMQISDERWFLMGDNRAVSVDSRSSMVGCVASEQVVGRIVFRLWPLSEFGPVK